MRRDSSPIEFLEEIVIFAVFISPLFSPTGANPTPDNAHSVAVAGEKEPRAEE